MSTDTASPPRDATTDGTGAGAGEYEQLLSALRRFLRTEGEVRLADPSISSIGIENRTRDGGRSPDVSVRFTVEKGSGEGGAPESFGPAPAAPGGPSSVDREASDGYDPAFLGIPVPVPVPDGPLLADVAPTVDGGTVVEHMHFSLQMSASRRFAIWVGWNIDGGTLKSLSRKGHRFVKDPRIAGHHQVGDELYSGNDLDRGHIARRADLIWGSLPVAQRANRDSFLFTNIAPQMDDFNQSAQSGVWGLLEDAVFADVEVEDLKVSVFGGPVFAADDRVYRGVRLPREYWKLIAFREAGTLKARAFLLTQNLDPLEALELDEFRVFQIAVPEIEARTGLRFPDVLRAADTLALPELVGERQPLRSVADIAW